MFIMIQSESDDHKLRNWDLKEDEKVIINTMMLQENGISYLDIYRSISEMTCGNFFTVRIKYFT